MATNTPILGLKKPVPNVEENWAFRLNESLDILDQSLLVGNASSTENVTTFNDGVGHLLISGSTNPVFDHVEAITFNSEFVTVVTGTFSEEVAVGSTTVILGEQITTTSGIFDDVVFAGVSLTGATPVDNSFKLLFVATDRKAANTDGGTFTSGAWRTRTLNSVDSNLLPGASLSSNTITLSEPGDYFIEWSAPAYRTNRHKTILYNTTDAVTAMEGSNDYSNSGHLVSNISVGGGKFHIDKSTNFQIRHQAETTHTTFGFGVASNFGEDEIYTQVRIWPSDPTITALDTLIAASGTYTGGLTVSGAPVVTTDSFVNVAESPLKVWSPDAVPDNGSSFDSEWNSGGLSGWTTWNVGGFLSTGVFNKPGVLRLRHDTPSSTSSVAGIFKTAPTNDFTIYTKLFYHNNVSIDFHEFGIIIASGIADNPSTANFGTVSVPAHRTSAGTESYSFGFATQHFTDYQTFDRNIEFFGVQFPANEPIYLKIHVDVAAIAVSASWSRDGLIWGAPIAGDFSGDLAGITEIGYWINSTIDPELIISSDFFRVQEHIDTSKPLPGNFVTVSGFTNPVSLENIDELSAVSGTFSQSLTISGVPVNIGAGSGDTLQNTYDAGDGTIAIDDGKPLELTSSGGFVAVTGTFTEGLTIGTGSTHINQHSIVTATGIFSGDEENLVVIGDDEASFTRVLEVRGRLRATRGLAIGRSTIIIEDDYITASGITTVTGCFTEAVFIGDPESPTVISGSDSGAASFDAVETGFLQAFEAQVDDRITVGVSGAGPTSLLGISVLETQDVIASGSVQSPVGIFPDVLNFPQFDTDPTPQDGDVWINTTTSGIRWQVNGTVFQVIGSEVA